MSNLNDTLSDNSQLIDEIKTAIKEEFSLEMKAITENLFQKIEVVKEENSLEIKAIKKSYCHLENLLNQVKKDLSNLRQTNQELIEHRQENVKLREKNKAWAESYIEILESLERNKKSIDIDKTYQEATNKILIDFKAKSLELGLEVIDPEPNMPFNENFYVEVSKESSPNVEEGKIVKCYRWGYKLDGEVLKKAEVVVATSSMSVNQKDS